jgi:pantothenate kinase-related protein Tda10
MEAGRLGLSSSLPTNLSLFDEVMRKKKTPFIIGVCGGTASGKTSVCEDIFLQTQEKEKLRVCQRERQNNTTLIIYKYR